MALFGNAKKTTDSSNEEKASTNTHEDSGVPSIVEFSVDLGDQEAPKPLPESEYRATIRSAVKKTSQKGTQYGEVGFFIAPDQYPADFTEGNPDGTVLFFRRVSLEDNPQARFGTRRFIEAIGAKLGKRIDLNDWLGLEAAVEVKHEEYEGVPRANIVKVRAA